MSSFKQLTKSDVFVVPYIANKQWNFAYNSTPTGSYIVLYEGENISFFETQTTTSLGEYKSLIYNSINHNFYQHYSGSSLNTHSLMLTVENYQSASQQRPTGSYFIYNDKLVKNFPTGANDTIQVLSVSKNIYGEKILPYSFRLSYSSSIITDDGVGNLKTGSTHVGNIFYSYGISVITNQSFQNVTYPLSLSFQNEYTIYENYITCKIRESEFNLSYNPTLIKSGSECEIKDFTTGSFAPYATTIGLYNDKNELLMVAKFAQPMLISEDTDMTFQIKFDT